ncbi:MAG: type III-B CRISPR module RAMP protein Cmr4 [Candidatus Eisenbacteria bacterium]|nr:type III-B CRISPR module RAMP protein Cmr4 [Candidatus Eisenbacteria bacterium]
MPSGGCLFTFYTLTSLHAGAGESTAAVDLAIQREKHTEYPVVYSSSMKGSLRWHFQCKGHANIDQIFGSKDEKDGSGQVVFTDAKILFFPVRSSEGVFKWVTCPFVLNRLFDRDLLFLGNGADHVEFSGPPDATGIGFGGGPETTLLLEDFPIKVGNNSTKYATLKSYLKKLLEEFVDENTIWERLIIVSNNVFKTLVTSSTQVIARNEIDYATKTSKNLWYEEVVPADAVFYTIMTPTYRDNGVIADLAEHTSTQIMQIGGNETIGYGFVRMSANLAGQILGALSAAETIAESSTP